MAGVPAKLLLLASTQVTRAAAGCSAWGWFDAYGGERCYNNGDVMDVSCNDKNSGAQCGARIQHPDAFGIGEIALSIKAAPGAGVVTSYYLSNNGGMYDEHGSWSEIDFEIMGKQATGGGTQIWTNYFTGSGVEHHGFVSVPFDVSAAPHVYSIFVNFSHIQWKVDGNVVRSDDYTAYPDMSAAVRGNTFKAYASVWGKSYADPDVGCREFLDGMGKLNDNWNQFPVHSTFQPVEPPEVNCATNFGSSNHPCTTAEFPVCVGYQEGAAWGQCQSSATQAKYQIGHVSAGAQRAGAVAAAVLSAAAAATALSLAAVAAARRRRPVSEQEEPLAAANAEEE